MTSYARNFGGVAPLTLHVYAYGCKKKKKKKNSLYLMFNLPLTKSSQQRKTARHCRTVVLNRFSITPPL